MSDMNPHQDARNAIRWLQVYFESLRKWIAAVDEKCADENWMVFESNRVSTALGNGYRDNTQWVMNWVARHYYKIDSDLSLLVHVPLASKKHDDEDDVYCYLSCIKHPEVATDDNVPTYSRAWVGAPIVSGMKEQASNQWVNLPTSLVDKALKGALSISVYKIPMLEFGNSSESVKQKLDVILSTLLDSGAESQQGN